MSTVTCGHKSGCWGRCQAGLALSEGGPRSTGRMGHGAGGSRRLGTSGGRVAGCPPKKTRSNKDGNQNKRQTTLLTWAGGPRQNPSRDRAQNQNLISLSFL